MSGRVKSAVLIVQTGSDASMEVCRCLPEVAVFVVFAL